MAVIDCTTIFLDELQSRAKSRRSAADAARITGKRYARADEVDIARACYERAEALLRDAIRIENQIARTKLEAHE